MKIYNYFLILCVSVFITSFTFAQEKEAKLSISFTKVDSVNVCKALVTSEDKPVKEVSVKLYVHRLFGLLPIGDAVSTDENGISTFNFPMDIPAESNGKLTVIAKVEDDDNYGSFETKEEVNLGVIKVATDADKNERSLSASRERAPIYFMVTSDLIIAGIWGTLIYIVFQVFKIKSISSSNKKKSQVKVNN